jgi:hypothetical protein
LYLYTSLQNTSSANTSYASYAVNDGGHTSYGELGINNSNYSYTAAGYPNNTFSAPLATFVESYGGPLAIGTWDNQKISFIVNGSVNTADAMTINANATINIPSLTASQAVFTDASKNLVSVATTGTGSVVLNENPVFNSDITIGASAGFGGKTLGSGTSNEKSNTIFGEYALASNSFGVNNVAIGDYALNQYLFSDNNIAIGNNAGSTQSMGSDNIFIGVNAGVNTQRNNSIVIGTNAQGASVDNVTVIGNSSTVETRLAGTTIVNAFQANDNLQLLGSATANQNIATNQTSGNLTIGGASATGSTTLNGNVKLATKASLPTASAGLVEYDGLAFYNSIAASTRGVMPSEQYVILDTPYTLTSQTAAQKLFNASTNGAVTLPVGTYQFECLFSLTGLSITSGSYGFAMVAGTAVVGSQAWHSYAIKTSSFAVPANSQLTFNTAANITLTGLNTSTNATALIRGTIKITTAGTIIPSVSLGIASAAVVGANSYFKISPVSKTNAANITVGNWS